MKVFAVKGNICYSISKKEIFCGYGYVVCEDGISMGFFEELPDRYKKCRVFDYGEMLIIPGLVDLHIHAPQYSFRGCGMDHELMDWLEYRTFPEEAKYKDLTYADRAYGMFAENMRKGTTTRACIFATSHRKATGLLMEKMESSGIISYVGKVNMDRNAPEGVREETAESSAEETIEWLEAIEAAGFQRTYPILTPRFVPCCSDELMERLEEIREEYDLPVQSHLSESHTEMELVRRLCPNALFYGDVYNRYGLFGRDERQKEVKTVMAHCVWSVPQEVSVMCENGVYIAHCPASNMNLASGIAPVRKYLDMGMRVGLGSDVAGGHSDSILRAMADAVQASKMYMRYVDDSVKPVTLAEAFYMATAGGGGFFGKVGSFEAGYEFDAVVLDDSDILSACELSAADRLERAVYLDGGVAVRAKYVCGECIYDR